MWYKYLYRKYGSPQTKSGKEKSFRFLDGIASYYNNKIGCVMYLIRICYTWFRRRKGNREEERKNQPREDL